MGVAVYPRLGELLRAKGVSMETLGQQIAERYGLVVDARALYRLTLDKPVRQTDLEIAGAAATILGVGLDDLFRVEASAVAVGRGVEGAELPAGTKRRLRALFEEQDRRELTPSEQIELEALLAEWGQQLHQRRIQEIAERWDRPIDETRREVETRLAEALDWWREFEADPDRQQEIIAQARRRLSSIPG